MPKDRVTIDVPFALGVDQKSDFRNVEVGANAVLINARKQKNNVIQKRPGHVAVSKSIVSGSALAAASRGFDYRGAPMLSDGSWLYEYSDTYAEWAQRDRASQVVALDRIPVSNWQTLIGSQDLAVVNGYLVAVMTGDPLTKGTCGLFSFVQDLSTGAIVLPVAAIDYAQNILNAHVVVCGSTVVLTYVDSGGNMQMRTMVVSSASPGTFTGWSASTTLFLAAQTGGHFGSGAYDVCALDATRFALTYQTATSGTHLNPNGGTINNHSIAIETYTTAGAFGVGQYIDSIPTNADTQPWGFAIKASAPSGGYIYTVYAYVPNSGGDEMTVRCWGLLDNGGGTVTNTVTLTSGGSLYILESFNGSCAIENVDATHFVVWWQNGGVIGDNVVGAQQVLNSSDVLSLDGSQRVMPGLSLLSKPVNVSGVGCVALAHLPSTLQGSAHLVAYDWFGFNGAYPGQTPYQSRVVATVNVREMQLLTMTGLATNGGAFNGLSHFAPAPPIQGALVYIGYTVLAQYAAGSSRTTLTLQPFDLQSPLVYDAALIGNDLGLSGGCPMAFDGNAQAELGYIHYPENMVASPQTSGGGMADGAYSYIFVYEWHDAAGNLQQSATSTALAATVSGGSGSGSVSIAIPALAVTRRTGSAVRIVPYRTQAAGSIYYRVVGQNIPSTLVSPTGATLTTTWVDTVPDASIATNPLLYTTGGTLDNENPPSARCLIAHKTRWILGGCGDDPTIVWGSKQVVTGITSETPGFNEAIQIQASGAVRAMASLDDKLILFVQRGTAFGIEYVTGQGPDDTGANSDWTFPPQPIPCGCGAPDQRSIAVGPFGVMFKSNVGGPNGTGGIFVLTRDLQVNYVGAQVEAALAANPIVTSALVHPNAGRVYLTCVPNDYTITSGVRLVFDYLMGGLWSVDQIYDTDTATASAGARTSWVANASGGAPLVHWATPSGRVYRETSGLGSFGFVFGPYYDAGQWVTMAVQTGTLKPSLQGFARFWRIMAKGDQLSPCDFTLTLTFDDAPSGYYSESQTWTNAEILAFDRFPEMQVQKIPANQKAQSIQVLLSDAPPSNGALSTGAGAQWTALSLDVGVDKGVFKNLPSGQKS